jgi:DNA mismatch repair protein MutS
MQQYWEIKSAHKDKVLLFRMGDFFEMFHEDAVTAAPILGIALTVRNRKANDETKMCGVPHHSIGSPIAKLLQAGHKVAICDQIEDPALAKGLVKRAVTRVLTPGLVYDPTTMDQLSGHYITAYDPDRVAFFETTTGEAFFYWASNEERERLWTLIQPKELVLTGQQRAVFEGILNWQPHLSVHNGDASLSVLDRLIDYAVTLQGEDLRQTIGNWQERRLHDLMEVSANTIRQLEIFLNYKGDRRGSLLHAIDRTKTSSGARLLKSWLQFPLLSVEKIRERQERIHSWIVRPDALPGLRQILGSMGDIERRMGKIATPNFNARDLLALAQSLRAGLSIAEQSQSIAREVAILEATAALTIKLEAQIHDEPPIATREGGIFKKSVNPSLDELIALSEEGERMLSEFEAQERKSTGITSLKVRSNNVFGYFIEITNAHAAKAPSNYQRKQTLANAERYVTPELAALEAKILTSQTRRAHLEWEMLSRLRSEVLRASADLIHFARAISDLDVTSSLAWLAIENNYCRPQINEEGPIDLEDSRHPVVEQEVGHKFVPNSIQLQSGGCLLLTGPNMAGKSTLMRQVALVAWLGQIGSFVPGRRASLPIFKNIFTRIGASDSLSEGHSTFMIEMRDAAEIVARCDAKSLIILDEVGRGTSTFDGLSLAQAILEHLLECAKPYVLFATHYHELNTLNERYRQIRNAHMAIHEKSGEIEFLHTMQNGPANKSYGIHVAKLAGLPKSVTERAHRLLKGFEAGAPPQARQMDLWQQELI